MSVWAQRRFWSEARPALAEGGFSLLLDGRPVKTPARAPLVVPTEALAHAIAGEWMAQTQVVDPETMPLTRAANSAIDKVTPQRPLVAEAIAAYGDADQLCYRAADPAALVSRQSAAWDPLLAWAADALDAPLVIGTGIVHVGQPAASLAALSRRVHRLSPFALTALHDLVSISGSLVIGLRVLHVISSGRADEIEPLWQLSRIDEDWQAEQWGEDPEATATARAREAAFRHAARFYELGGPARDWPFG